MTDEPFVPKVIKDFNEQLNDPNHIPFFQFEPKFQASDSYGNHDEIKKKVTEQLKHNRITKIKLPKYEVSSVDGVIVVEWEQRPGWPEREPDKFDSIFEFQLFMQRSEDYKRSKESKPKHPLGRPEDDIMEGVEGDW